MPSVNSLVSIGFNFDIRVLVLLVCMACFCGCPLMNKGDLSAASQMRNVCGALKNYNDTYGMLPPATMNTWRFSNSTKYKNVNWRTLLLTDLYPLGTPKDGSPMPQAELEKQIDLAGKLIYESKFGLICLNYSEIKKKDLKKLPQKMILAIMLHDDESDWMDDQPVNLLDALRNKRNRHSDIYILFVDGSVGMCRGWNSQLEGNLKGDLSSSSTVPKAAFYQYWESRK